MKKLFNNSLSLLILAFLLLGSFNAHAVYVEKMPVAMIQPNGDTLHFFATGDECYHRYHDDNNFTIVQNQAGYWVYAMPASTGGLQPSQYLVGTVNPATVGLTPGLKITHDQWLERRHAWDIPEEYRIAQPKTSGRNHGDYCNLVIFIRFADDVNYSRSLSSIDRMFSDSTTYKTTSVYNFFKRVSYNKLFVRTYYAPTPDSNTIRSYQSPHPRGYYMPYTEHNPEGYTNYNERTNREFELLVGAVNFINDSFPVPSTYNLDNDGDGYIDNVNFVVKGTYTGWSDLLWPHKWNLYGYNVFINGKQVNTFNFALEGAGADYFGTSTFCHEMFHSLGAPDLYRYNEGTEVSPVGSWDLMATNSKPPQHMSAYMKYKYGNWLDIIPIITTPGTYTLHSVGDSVPGTMAYLFPSSSPDQFYLVEYRDNTEIFETTLPGRGLLISRIDTRFNGNADWNGRNNFDEVWIFRPNSNNNMESGMLAEAYFSPNRHRTSFSPSTSYYPYLSDGTRDLSFAISNVTTPGNTISFAYTNRTMPADLKLVQTTTATAQLQWLGIGMAYRVKYRRFNSDDEFKYKITHGRQITLTDLEPNTEYEWTVRALYDQIDNNTYADSSQLPSLATFHTELCNNSEHLEMGYEDNNNARTGIPFVSNKKYNYSQQIFTSDEFGGAKTISTIALDYAHTTDFTRSNCTIYMANTTISEFNDSVKIVPFSQLTKVYEGPMNFTQGWNEIVLDSPFYYNGTDNLVVAIDDNSGTITNPGNRFYIHNTNTRLGITYSSTDKDPNPMDDDTIVGDRNWYEFRYNIRFAYCPDNEGKVYACVISENEERGQVIGDGLFDLNETITITAIPINGFSFKCWNDNSTENPRNVVLTQDTLFVAYFTNPVGIDPTEDQGGYLILSQQHRITIQGAENEPIQIYNLLGQLINSASQHHPHNTTFNLPTTGIYLVKVGNNKPVKLLVR